MESANKTKILLCVYLTLMVFFSAACAMEPVVQSYGRSIHAWLDENIPNWDQGFIPLHWAFGTNEETTVAPEEPAPLGVEGVGEVMTDAFTVSVYEGYAGEFSTPPKISYANYEEYPPTLGTTIYYNASTVYPYYNWLTFPDNGAWIEMQTNEPVSAIGVQLWGDYEDGWVRISVDGTPIWQGNTNFENCSFDTDGNRLVGPDTCEGGFYYYIQASALEITAHTIRVTNIGSEQMTIYFFGLGMAKP